jgi:glycosyltransferase involved in cell wall biosynthesis
MPFDPSHRKKIAHITTIDMSLHLLMLNQLLSIQADGYEVVGISTPGEHIQAVTAVGIRYIPITMARAISPWQDLKSLWQLYRVIRREKFIIVHTHNPKPALIAQLAARFARTPVIIHTLHGFHFHDNMSPNKRRFFIMMEKIGASCADVILSQNKEDMQTAIREHICPPEKIKHLGNGIDLAVFDPARISAEETARKRAELNILDEVHVVGFVGRLAARRKGFLDLLAAARELVQITPNVRFLIVGAPDEGKADALDPSIVHDYDLADHFIFLGARPNEELPLLYTLMDVLVLPSIFEGLPRVIMEASAMGIPVVATDVKGNREAVFHGRNGLLVPLHNVSALSAAIAEILSNPAKAESMGQEGRKIAAEHFDEQKVFEKVKAEYARLLQQKN